MQKSIDRRAVIAGAAAVPALSLPAIAVGTEADPIYAAIQRCIETDAAFVERVSKANSEAPEISVLVDANRDARLALAETIPTTLAGFAALFAFLERTSREWGIEFFDPKECEVFHATMAEASRRLAGKAVRG